MSSSSSSSSSSLIKEYITHITARCIMDLIPNTTTTIKATMDLTHLPIHQYAHLETTQYNVSQLKLFAKAHKLKQTGNKSELIKRLYSFLKLSYYAIKIQKTFRRKLVYKYLKMHGPAAMPINRALCMNDMDVVSMEPIKDINYHQFISYKDKDELIYGFDISTLHNLYLKSDEDVIKNPYNRNKIPRSIFRDIRALIRLGRILNISFNLNYSDDEELIKHAPEKEVEFKAIALFQSMDALGNYTDPNWFLALNKRRLLLFIKYLIDIWNYRAQLTRETQIRICPPHGYPMHGLNANRLQNEENVIVIKNILLDVMNKFVNSSQDKDNKCLGAFYVLSALTLVSANAAASMPWLYQSARY